ncbi:hypothetical protein BH09MYX1_BH09MYX1_17120 [soil metagenome]
MVQHGPLLRVYRDFGSRLALHETESPNALPDLMRQIKEDGADVVAFAGGDGAYMAGVTALRNAFGEDAMPEIALAPGGTVSTTARNWGLEGPLEIYAQRLLEDTLAGLSRSTLRPTLRIVDDTGGDRLGFIWGAGLVARFFDAYYAQPHAGYVGAARIVTKIFLGSPFGGKLARRVLTPVPCTITVDGVKQAAPGYSLMTASVVKNLGLHMQVLYRAAEDPKLVHFVASPLGAPLLGPQMPLVLAGKRLRGKNHVDALAKEVVIAFPEPDSYVLDGDVYGCRTVTVMPGPQISVLSPG